MAREFYLDDDYSPLGDGYYQPLYREGGSEIEADGRHWYEVRHQLGLEYDEREMKYYDPEEVNPFDPNEIQGDPREYYSLSLWATSTD